VVWRGSKDSFSSMRSKTHSLRQDPPPAGELGERLLDSRCPLIFSIETSAPGGWPLRRICREEAQVGDLERHQTRLRGAKAGRGTSHPLFYRWKIP